MRSVLNKLVLMSAVCMTFALSACLPDSSDPDKGASSSGQLSGAFYGNGLGSVALAVQNAVVTSSDWFSHVVNGEVNLAALNISSQGMGVSVKSYLCPADTGLGVRQLTWIDARGADGKFGIRGIGADSGTIVGSLRNRVSGKQIGVYSGSATITMADNSTWTIPSGCASASIPVGAPVLAFDIDRPAPPTAQMARTEYKTTACSADASGRTQRGSKVQNRTVQYMPSGAVITGGWSDDVNSGGTCLPDVVVSMTTTGMITGGASVNMNSFAGLALADLLSNQLTMDCSRSTVHGDMSRDGAYWNRNKAIDTCALAAAPSRGQVVNDNVVNDVNDVKILQCKGITPLMYSRFHLGGAGMQNTVWTYGTATLVRVLDNTNNNDKGTQAKRYKWLGTDISCAGYQTFTAICGIIPNNPAVSGRAAGNKFNVSGLGGWTVHTTWLNNFFGVCWFGSCKRINGGEIYNLNPSYFTGVDALQNYATTTTRNMGMPNPAPGADPNVNWTNRETFIPHTVAKTLWSVTDNQCLWQQRVMIADCPFVFDSAQETTNPSEYPSHISPWAARPVAIDPGMSSNGSDSANLYSSIRSSGYLTALVVLHWEKCTIKGCDHWDEPFGPGLGAYIKSWNGVPPTDLVTLSGDQVATRNQMCSDINYQLNALSIMQNSQNTMNVAQATMNNSQAVRDAAQYQVNVANNALNNAYNDMNNLNNEIANRYASAAYWQDAYNHAWDNYNNMAAANANYDNWYAASGSCNSKGCHYPVYSPPYSSSALTNEANNANYYSSVFANYVNSETATAHAYESYRPAYQAAINNALTNVYSQQASLNAAQTQLNTAADQYNTAVNNYNNAAAVNNAHLQHPLTADETNGLQTVSNLTCTSSTGVLDLNSQGQYKQACGQYFSNPGAYSLVPSVGQFCTSTFTQSGETLSFKINANSMYGGDVQTTLLNTEGVELAWRPVLENNTIINNDSATNLITRQHGFTEELWCARSEYQYIQWPVIQNYWQCGGKGGCHQASYYSTRTITKSIVREWHGLSYETGTWTHASQGVMTPWGNYNDVSEIPSPVSVW